MLMQSPLPSTGNPKLDAIAQASALGLALASVIVGTFGRKKKPTKAQTSKPKSKPANTRVAMTQQEIDDANNRR
jgi:hypothetical protein